MLTLLSLIACTPDQGIVVKPDTTDPQIAMVAPEVGGWVSAGPTTLTGSYNDLSQVTANSADASLSDASWSSDTTLQRGVNVLNAEGMGTNGDVVFERGAVLAGTFGDPVPPIKEALIARLNEDGLNQVLGYAENLLDLSALTSDLSALNPIVDDTLEIWGLDLVDYVVNLNEITFDDPIIRVDPKDGYLYVEVEVPHLYVDTVATSDVWGYEFDVGVTLEAVNVLVDAEVFIDVESGQLVVEVGDSAIDLVGFSYSTSVLPSWLEDYLLVDTIKGFIEDTFLEQLTTLVPEVLAGVLEDLPLSFELDLLGNPLTLEGFLADAFVDEDGIQLSADMSVSMPASSGQDYAGYLSTDSLSAPQLSKTSPMSASMSDDMINRLLFEVWRAGVMELEVGSDDPTMGVYIGLMLELLNADEGAIGISAGLPPVAVERDGVFEVQAGELGITLLTPGGGLGESLTMNMAMFMALELGIADNCLELGLGEPELALMVRESDWGASNEATTVLMEEMLPIDTLLGAVDLLLGEGFCDLLPVEGITLDQVTMERDPNGGHMLMEITVGLE